MEETGVEVPALANKPEPNEWVQDIWAGFLLIVDSRPIGMGGVGAIPLTEMVSLLGVMGVDDDDERLRWLRLLKLLDAEYVTYMSRKAAEASNRGGTDRKQRN